MLQTMQTNGPSKEQDIAKDWAIIAAKSAEELAESLEIMMIQTRPIGIARVAMRDFVHVP